MCDEKIHPVEVPQVLYKYRSYDKRSIRMLVENKLYFAPPIKFNDPFDCALKVEIDKDMTSEEFLQGQKAYALKNGIDWQDYEQKLKTQCFDSAGKIKPRVFKQLRTNVKAVRHKHLKKHGVCCFCKQNNDILLWAHYANKHKGFCIEFRYDQDYFLGKYVLYGRDYPSVKVPDIFMNDDEEKKIGESVWTKSCGWSYEQEWRVVRNEVGEVEYDPSLIKGIIFGCRMGKPSKNKIRIALKDRPHIQYYDAKLSSERFELDIVPA